MPLLLGQEVSLLFVDRGSLRSELDGSLASRQRFVEAFQTAQCPSLIEQDIFILRVYSQCLLIGSERLVISMQIPQHAAPPLVRLRPLGVKRDSLIACGQSVDISFVLGK